MSGDSQSVGVAGGVESSSSRAIREKCSRSLPWSLDHVAFSVDMRFLMLSRTCSFVFLSAISENLPMPGTHESDGNWV